MGAAPSTPGPTRLADRFADAFGLVLLLVLATYIASSLLDYEGWPAVLVVAIGCAAGFMALVGARLRPSWLPVAAWVAIAAVAMAALSAILDDSRAWLALASTLEVGLLSAAIVAVLRRIILASEVGVEPILGAISVYALLGIMFAVIYSAIHRLANEPFFTAVAEPRASDFVFFSYTTLTTTGYGNLVPAGQPGEMLAGLEMLVGQIFLVTLIARLVALWQPGEKLRAARAARSGDV